jgi:uncharacterized membrane protein YkvA (DUF1232 family)
MTEADTQVELTEKEQTVREGFWPKLRRFASRLPFVEEAISAYYSAFDRKTPMAARLTLLGALAYFIAPVDAIPDFLPLMGFADDAGVLSAAIVAVSSHIREEHREAARRAILRMKGGAQA